MRLLIGVRACILRPPQLSLSLLSLFSLFLSLLLSSPLSSPLSLSLSLSLTHTHPHTHTPGPCKAYRLPQPSHPAPPRPSPPPPPPQHPQSLAARLGTEGDGRNRTCSSAEVGIAERGNSPAFQRTGGSHTQTKKANGGRPPMGHHQLARRFAAENSAAEKKNLSQVRALVCQANKTQLPKTKTQLPKTKLSCQKKKTLSQVRALVCPSN